MPAAPAVRRLVLLLGCLILPASAGAASRYDVLLVSIDSLRRDALGCYGARLPHAPDAPTSPRLDRLAAGGIRLVDALASSPWTLPSHVSLLTGRSPVVHHVETDLNVMRPDQATLAQVLHDAGYRTAGVFSGPYLEPHWGFARGFDRYRAAYGDAVAKESAAIASIDREIERADAAGDHAAADELRYRRRKAYEKVRAVSHADVSAERVTASALEDMDRLAAADAPWFLFVHYFDVHYDYVPPKPFDTKFDPHYAGAITGRDYLTNPAVAVENPRAIDAFLRRASDRDVEHLRALYAGEVAAVDGHGRLLDRLDALHAGDRTLVVVVSDHGDEFFEHDGIGHRRTVADEVLRIPVIARLPEVLPAGRAVSGLVGLGDIVPTILDLMGFAPLPGTTGRSIMSLVRGDEDGHGRVALSRLVRVYDGQAHLPTTNADVPVRLAVVQEAFRYGPTKVVRRRRWPLFPLSLPAAQRRELQVEADAEFRHEDIAWVDVSRFPNEPDAAFSNDFQAPQAHAALAMFRRRYRELRAAATGAVVGTPSAEVRQRLEGLGYVEASSAPVSPRDGFALPLPGNHRDAAPH